MHTSISLIKATDTFASRTLHAQTTSHCKRTNTYVGVYCLSRKARTVQLLLHMIYGLTTAFVSGLCQQSQSGLPELWVAWGMGAQEPSQQRL